MLIPSPIPAPWPIGLTALAVGTVLGGAAALLLAECDDEDVEALLAPDIHEKLAALTAMREAQDISEEEYQRMRKTMLDAFAAS